MIKKDKIMSWGNHFGNFGSSSVFTYPTFADFPVTGQSNIIYIALDTGVAYFWNGTIYQEFNNDTTTIWGGITGTLSNQTDLQNALNAKQNLVSLPIANNLLFTNVDGQSIDSGYSINITDPFTTPSSVQLTNNQEIYNFVTSLVNSSKGLQPVTLLFTTNQTLSGLPTQGGYTCIDGDRVICTGQTDTAQNLVYNVHSGAWTVASDSLTVNQLLGAWVSINKGINATDYVYLVNITPSSGNVTPTAVNWSTPVEQGLYQAGTGLLLTGSIFSIADTTVTSGSYTLNGKALFTVNTQGQLTSSSDVSLALGDISNVSLTSPANNNWLGYNGTNWVNNASGDLTEATSSVLTITSGSNSVLNNVSIEVKQATTSESGYLSNTDWTTFNDKAPINNPDLTGTVAITTATQGNASLTATNNGAVSTTTGGLFQALQDSSVALTSGYTLGNLQFGGAYNTSHGIGIGANIVAQATQTWTASTLGSNLLFQTVPNGSTTLTTALTLGQDQSATFAGAIYTLNVLSTGALTVNSNTTNALNLDSGTTGAVNIGNGTNAKTVTVGNTTANTAVNINAGTGLIRFTSNGKVNAIYKQPKITIFTANGIWTPDANASYVIIECCGAGGGSSNASSVIGGIAFSNSGGGGGYIKALFPSQSLPQPVAVGISAIGSAGGTSLVGTLCSAGGGSAGTTCISVNITANTTGGTGVASGGTAGTQTGGTTILAMAGGGVQRALYIALGAVSNAIVIIPNGGSSALGIGGRSGSDYPGIGTGGISGTGFGAGAGGASASNGGVANGIAGTNGIVIITEYYF